MTTAVLEQEQELTDEQAFGRKLQDETTGCRITAFALSSRRAMTTNAVSKMAETFEANAQSISGSRQIINRKHPIVKMVYKAIRRAKDFVNAYSVDYPEAGIRLVRLDNISWIASKVGEIEIELDEALQQMDDSWEEIKADAKERLGQLFSESDYPEKPSEFYGIELSFPAIDPDERLAKIHPHMYEEQKRKIAERFDDAVKMAEAAAADELAKILEHLVERLQPGDDGKAKTVRESTFANIAEFAERFSRTSIGTNAELEKLVKQVQDIASGVDVKVLRKAPEEKRNELKAQFDKLKEAVGSLVISRPTRFIEDEDGDE